jgi:MoaA/NifB/PqqE/SkfB family radical SAM enzyme
MRRRGFECDKIVPPMDMNSPSETRRKDPSTIASERGLLSTRFLVRNFFNLIVRRRIDFAFDRIPLQAAGLSIRKIVNLFLIGFNRVFRISRAIGRPYMAHISPSGVCDLSCSLCPVHDETNRGRTLMSLEVFKKFIDEAGGTLLYVILWGWGEPLLNPDLPRMIACARERGILTICSTNLNRLKPATARDLVASGLDVLIVALDGATEETAARLRPGSSAGRVVENLKLLRSERERAGSTKPFLNLRMVVSRDNEAEVEAFRRLARELGADMVSFKAFSTRQPGYADSNHDRTFAPAEERYRWYEYQADFAVDPDRGRFDCRFPWTKPTLFPDGDVAICEFDFHSEVPLGNIKDRSFRRIWFGPEARSIRRRFLRDRAGLAFCRDCVYDYKKIPGCVVDWEFFRT